MSSPAENARALFRKHFGALPTRIIAAPGRVELLGNHTDYNGGLVLAAAIDRHLALAVSPRADGTVRLVSDRYAEPIPFLADDPSPDLTAPWAAYVKGVLALLGRRGISPRGFDAAVAGDLPAGAGLSSSAALTTATLLASRSLYPFSLQPSVAAPVADRSGQLPKPTATERLEFARLCQTVEREFAGVNCGLLDPLTILSGRDGCALELDFLHLTVEPVPLPAGPSCCLRRRASAIRWPTAPTTRSEAPARKPGGLWE